MLSSYENCPICNRQLRHIKNLNKPCPLIGKPKISFVESICNHVNFNKEDPLFTHQFFQITSLYGNLMLQKICFPDKGWEMEVNYVLHKTKLEYWHKVSTEPQANDIVVVDILIEPDYPKLEKIIKKFKTFAPFL